MARYTFNLPDIGEGIAEAEIVEWHVKLGDTVSEDDQLADMMTDKATVEMECPVSGTIVEIAGEVGDMVSIGAMLAVIDMEAEEGGKGPTSSAGEAKPQSAAEPAAQVEKAVDPEQAPKREEKAVSAAVSDVDPQPASPIKVLASPAVRKRAQSLGIDLGQVKSASDGRVRHADLDAFLSYSGSQGYHPAGGERLDQTVPDQTVPDQTVKVIGLRRRIADNMQAAKRHIPHFTYVEECDVTALEALRAQLNAARREKPKLTMLPLLITAICRTLPDFPMINARFDDEAGVVTRHGAVHLGMATQTDSGLMVPVIRDAQVRNLWQLADEIARLAAVARDGSAQSAELSGSTLTVTSLGPLGGVATTPVINRPEVAIIGPNRIVERPMFVADGIGGERVEKRKLMNISISCDHRVVDGYDAASFIQALKHLLEAPANILAG